MWLISWLISLYQYSRLSLAHNYFYDGSYDDYLTAMRHYFISESINHIPQMLINLFLVYRIIFITEDMYPNKVDQVLNREISQLVFLKNKIKQPDLFGVHDQV